LAAARIAAAANCVGRRWYEYGRSRAAMFGRLAVVVLLLQFFAGENGGWLEVRPVIFGRSGCGAAGSSMVLVV
jgi:hypothetical protein